MESNTKSLNPSSSLRQMEVSKNFAVYNIAVNIRYAIYIYNIYVMVTQEAFIWHFIIDV